MQDPTTVTGIIERIHEARRQLDRVITALTNVQIREPKLDRGQSVKDKMAHIAFWDYRMIHLITCNEDEPFLRLAPPEIADIPYEDAWQWTDAVNERIYDLNFEKSLIQVRAEFDQNYEDLVEALEMLSDEDVFDPGGISSFLGISFPELLFDIYNHYDHHTKEIDSTFH